MVTILVEQTYIIHSLVFYSNSKNLLAQSFNTLHIQQIA